MTSNPNNSSIRVSIRVRPPEVQTRKKDLSCIDQVGTSNILLLPKDQHHQTKQFVFDNVYWENNLQESIFQDIGQPIVYNALNGYNCSIFAYGQTGSGKSYTMFGIEDDSAHEGLVPRICKAILNVKLSGLTFHNPQSQITGSDYDLCTVKVSYIEIYLERVKDLLSESVFDNKLKVRENPSTGTYVEGARIVEIKTYEELQKLLQEGSSRRAMAVTKMNENSSRSHAVFTILLQQTLIDEFETVHKNSKIHLVDLAGSENNKSTGATGVRQREASYINKSLLTLSRVILALSRNQSIIIRQQNSNSAVDNNSVISPHGSSSTSSYLAPPTTDSPSVSPTSLRRKKSFSGLYDSNPGQPQVFTFSSTSTGLPAPPGSDPKERDPLLISSDEEDTTVDGTISDSDFTLDSSARGMRKSDPTGLVPVPYRDSVLTQLLRECLGGNAKTVLIATIRCEYDFHDDTLSTLRFAGKAKKVMNLASVNQQTYTMSTIERLQRQVLKLESELAISAAQKLPATAVYPPVVTSSSSVQVGCPLFATEQSEAEDFLLGEMGGGGGGGKVTSGADAESEQQRLQQELDDLKNLIRDLTAQRDVARQVQQIQQQELEEVRREAHDREAKLLEDQRVKEEQIRFLMTIQSRKESAREREQREGGGGGVGDGDGDGDGDGMLSDMERKGKEMLAYLSARKAKRDAYLRSEETCITPACEAVGSISNSLFSFSPKKGSK